MSRAKKLNSFFTSEFRNQKHVLDLFDRRPKLMPARSSLSSMLRAVLNSTPVCARVGRSAEETCFTKSIEHVKRLLENAVSQEALKPNWPHPARHRRERRAVHGVAGHGGA